MKWFWVAVAIVILALLVWWAVSQSSTPATQSSQATTTLAADIIPGVSNETYTNSHLSFSIQYPSVATSSPVDYSGFLPVTQTSIVSFTLPHSMFQGTNLGEAGVYIGASTSPAVMTACLQPSVENGEANAGTETINGQIFAVATSTGVGAGNIYEEKTYRAFQNGSCLEITELLHSGNIDNYPSGTVQQFNHDQFANILDAIVHTYQSIPTGP